MDYNINFPNLGIYLPHVGKNLSIGGFTIAYYGIVIAVGMLLASQVVMWRAKELGENPDDYLDVFLVTIVVGIIGARVYYVVFAWDAYKDDILSVFNIREGGLAIYGGIIFGILAIYFMSRFKKIKPGKAFEAAAMAVPIGQILGRWGNFFNKEVYGAAVPASSMSFLPTWISHQMDAGAGNIYVPLFLVEGLLNIAGYFIIVYAVGKLLKKWLVRGDLGGCYLIWYGIVRLILEPLRDPSFNMGSNGQWSSVWAIIYIAAGFLLIFGLHLFDYFYHVKGNHPRMIPSWHGIKEYEWKRDPMTYTIEDPNLPRTVAHKNKVNSKKVELGEDVPVGESKDEPLPLNDKEE